MSSIKSTPLVDQVYQDIKNRIVKGELEPNSKLNVRSLCEFYGISDTPLKQAMNRLVSEHLVVALPRRGMRVVSFSQQDIHEAIQARIMIETYAVPYAIKASQGSKVIIKALEENLIEDEKLIQETNISLYSEDAQKELETSQNFHLIVVRSIGNATITNTYMNILNHRYVYYQSGCNKTTQALSSLNEHRQILERLKAGDEEGMKASIIAHLKAREYDVASVTP